MKISEAEMNEVTIDFLNYFYGMFFGWELEV